MPQWPGDASSIRAPIIPLGMAIAPSVAETGHSGQVTEGYDKGGARVSARTESFDMKLGGSIESSDFCAIPNTRQVWQALEDTLRLKGQKFPPQSTQERSMGNSTMGRHLPGGF